MENTLKEEKIRELKAAEKESKPSQISDKAVQLLLYKTSRTDMAILDEVFGRMNWQCEYKEIKGNMYCGISVYDETTKQWITKWDCGVESQFGDKEKGEASDAFKRAGFKWGIGVELYTPPYIYIPSRDKEGKDNFELKEKQGKYSTYTKFEVEKIQIIDKEITALAIKNNKGKRVFVWQKEIKKKEKASQKELDLNDKRQFDGSGEA